MIKQNNIYRHVVLKINQQKKNQKFMKIEINFSRKFKRDPNVLIYTNIYIYVPGI